MTEVRRNTWVEVRMLTVSMVFAFLSSFSILAWGCTGNSQSHLLPAFGSGLTPWTKMSLVCFERKAKPNAKGDWMLNKGLVGWRQKWRACLGSSFWELGDSERQGVLRLSWNRCLLCMAPFAGGSHVCQRRCRAPADLCRRNANLRKGPGEHWAHHWLQGSS